MVKETMQPEYVSLWLRPGTAPGIGGYDGSNEEWRCDKTGKEMVQ